MSEDRKKRFNFIQGLKTPKSKPVTQNTNAKAAASQAPHSESIPTDSCVPSPDQPGSTTAAQSTPMIATSSSSPPVSIVPKQKEPEVAQDDAIKNGKAFY